MRIIKLGTLVTMVAFVMPAAAVAQDALILQGPWIVTLAARQQRSVQVAATPGTVKLLELNLEGGLVAVKSAEAPRRVLDIGRGGRLWFAVTADSDGLARIDLTSAEQTRVASLTLRDITAAHGISGRQHIRAAGIAFASADEARRHLPNAPSVTEALRLYDTAASEAKIGGDTSLARWAMAQKARYLMYQKSSFEQTSALLRQADALPNDDDDAVQALVLKTLSSAEYFTGDLSAAIVHAEQALALYRRTGDVYWQGIVLGNLISTYGESGREADAVAAGREALSDAEQTQDAAGVVFALTELGTLYRDQGRYQMAFETYRSAQQWGESIHYAPLVEAEIEKELAGFYVDLDLWDEAEQQIRLCLRKAAPDGETALDARGLLARLLKQRNDNAGALREYRTALSVARKLGLPHVEGALRLQRASAFLDTGDVAMAEHDADEADLLSDRLHEPALRIGIALLQGNIGEHRCAACAETERHFNEALLLAHQFEMREGEAAAHAGLARVFQARGANQAALDEIDRTLLLVEHSRSSLASRELAASYFSSRRDWYKFAIDTAMEASRDTDDAVEAAFRYGERARARSMLDIVGEHEVSTDTPNPTLERRVAANEYQLQRQLKLLVTSPDPQTIAPTVRALYSEQDALAAERAGPHHTQDVAARHIATLREVRTNLLEPGSAMVVFSVGAQHTYRCLITPEHTSVSVLPAIDQLRRVVTPLQRLLTERSPTPRITEDAEQYGARQRAWRARRDRSLQSAAHLLLPSLPPNVHHLYIVADAGLSALPWAALRVPCEQGRRRTCYMVERAAISLEPSASIALELAARLTRPTGQAVLVIADTIRSQNSQPLRWEALAPIPGSGREAEAIAQLVPHSSFHELRGEQATIDNLRAHANTSLDILHIAAHTILIADHPELSGIALSPGPRGTREGPGVLWLADIPSLHVPRLVTLSGCTTQGQDVSGEELASLTQAFFYAGAQQVVATLWNVDDDAAATLIRRFYRKLLVQHLTVPSALQQAQLSMLHEHDDLADWAAFVINGNDPHSDSSP